MLPVEVTFPVTLAVPETTRAPDTVASLDTVRLPVTAVDVVLIVTAFTVELTCRTIPAVELDETTMSGPSVFPDVRIRLVVPLPVLMFVTASVLMSSPLYTIAQREPVVSVTTAGSLIVIGPADK